MSPLIPADDSVIESNDYPVSEVSMLADYYIEKGRNESAISLLQKALKTAFQRGRTAFPLWKGALHLQ